MPLWVGALIGLAFGLAILLVWALNDRVPEWASQADESPVMAIETATPARRDPAPIYQDDLRADRENAIVSAIRRVSPAVVSVNSVRREAMPVHPTDMFSGREPRQSMRAVAGLGSGILVDARGFVLTSNHVVAGADDLQITMRDGQTFNAELVGASPEYDLAVIKIAGEVSGLPVAPLGDSDRVVPGEWAIAIGSPFSDLLEDAQPTVTVGVISAVNRSVLPTGENTLYRDMIQTDATINPGNSGGPLVDSRGEVVGINTTVITDREGARTGLGFAIPINRGRWVMEEILEFGRVRPFTTGLTGRFLNDQMRVSYGLGAEVPTGWVVQSVQADSPASRAGLVVGDVITHVNSRALVDDRARARSLFEARVGLTLSLAVWRQGSVLDTQLTLEEDPRARKSSGN